MATIARIRFTWSGSAVVGGGVSTFYSSNLAPATITTAIRTFLVSAAGLMPSTVEITPPSGGELIDAATGALAGAWTMTPGAVVPGGGGGAYASGVGMRCVLNTAGVTRRRRVRGSFYLVPLASSIYDSNGNLNDGNLSLLRTALSTMVAADSGSLRVWSRPTTITAGDGAAHDVLSGSIPDKISWLRSRRT